MLETRFTRLVGCSVPIQSAAVGGLSTHILAPAVADAGGLGMVAITGWSANFVATILDQVREQTSGKFGANFLMPFADPDTIHDVISTAAKRANVVEFFYGEPDASLVQTVHDAGSLACWQIGSLEEALAAVEAKCDLIIAQGVQAGGHVRGKIGMLTLLNQVLEAVDIPVLAAGGIGNGRTMAAALAAGADGVRVGTRFVSSIEANAHEEYVQSIIDAEAKDTVLTEAYSVEWPDAPHRVLKKSIEAAQNLPDGIIAEGLNLESGEQMEILHFSITTPGGDVTGHVEALPHYAGDAVDMVKKKQSAAEIISEMSEACEKLLRRW